jgi:hypothetical protein
MITPLIGSTVAGRTGGAAVGGALMDASTTNAPTPIDAAITSDVFDHQQRVSTTPRTPGISTSYNAKASMRESTIMTTAII